MGYHWTIINRDPIILACQTRYGPATLTGLREVHLEEIEQWCIDNDCGRRIALSPNMFEMNNEEQLTHFLLRWS